MNETLSVAGTATSPPHADISINGNYNAYKRLTNKHLTKKFIALCFFNFCYCVLLSSFSGSFWRAFATTLGLFWVAFLPVLCDKRVDFRYGLVSSPLSRLARTSVSVIFYGISGLLLGVMYLYQGTWSKVFLYPAGKYGAKELNERLLYLVALHVFASVYYVFFVDSGVPRLQYAATASWKHWRMRLWNQTLPKTLLEGSRCFVIFGPIFWLTKGWFYRFCVRFCVQWLGITELSRYPLARYSISSEIGMLFTSWASVIFVYVSWQLLVSFLFEYLFCAHNPRLSQRHINPNDCLMQGLALPCVSPQIYVKAMAFLELESIAKIPSDRRKTIFSEIDDIPTVWIKYSNLICSLLDDFAAGLEADVAYAEAYVKECKEQQQDLKFEALNTSNLRRTMQKPRLHDNQVSQRFKPIRKAGDYATSSSQPTKLSIFQYIVSLILGLDAVSGTESALLSKEDASEATSNSVALVPNVFLSSTSQTSSSSSTTSTTPSSSTSKKESIEKRRRLLEFLVLDSWKGGKLLLQQIKRLHCDSILGERLVIYCSALQAISHLVRVSLEEDEFGQVQRTVPKILKTMIRCHSAILAFHTSYVCFYFERSYHYKEVVYPLFHLKDVLTRSIYTVIAPFYEHIGRMEFSNADLALLQGFLEFRV